MNKAHLFYLLFVLFVIVEINAQRNLHIGTGGFGYGCGSNSPAVQVPYSFVRLGPDTSPMIKKEYKKFQHYGGYHDSDHGVRAFSHLHLVGAGVIDMGVIGVLPTINKNQNQPPNVNQDKVISFSKSDQKAQPGYYSTVLSSQNIKVELTTSQRCGAHRYTYINYKNKPMDINIMTSYLLDRKSPRYTSTMLCGQNCIEGKILVMGGFGGRFGGYTVHFHLQWHSPFDEQSEVFLYKDNTILDKSHQSTSGNFTGAVIRTRSNVIELYFGLSYVSVENAKINYQNQIKGKRFDAIKSEAQNIWNKQLKRFDIYAIDKQVQAKIDTAIYRTLLTPTIFEDSNNQYVSFRNDGSKNAKPASMSHVYTDMSIWDVHRTQMPWILLHDPNRFADIAMSIVLINRQGGYMPKWPFAQGATGCMIGSHANTILADWIIKQAHKQSQKYNISQIFGFMLRNANNQTVHDSRHNPTEYLSHGYIPCDQDARSSCSETLQYSYNDFGISQIAKHLNFTDIHTDFIRRSKFYKNIWNSKTKFFEPKFKNGTFKKISSTERINIFSNNYVEGNAWHYRFYAPHDPSGLIQLFGGQKIFVRQLNRFFSKSFSWPTFWLPNPYYWAGNQHDLFSVWLFPFANRSDLTERYSRMIVDSSYGVSGNGLPGNDDYATMSAWLIFATLGFYPLPSTSTYILGSPYVHYARIDRKIKEDVIIPLRIRANNNNRSNIYVQKSQLNKKPITKTIDHKQFENPDFSLEFWMENRDPLTVN